MPMLKSANSTNNVATFAVILIAASFLVYAITEYRDVKSELATSNIDRKNALNMASHFAGELQSHNNWLLVNFWASWCPPCREEMPLLETLHREQPWKDDFSVLTLSQDQDANPLKAYWNRYGFKMDGRMDVNQEISSLLGVEAYPTTILISPDNKIIKIWSGIEDWSGYEMEAQLSQLMNQSEGGS